MRIILAGTGAALIAALGGCGDTEPVAGNNVVEVPGPEAYQQELMGMEEEARNAVFIRAIRDADRECQHVETSSFSGEVEGFPVWQAQCSDGLMYAIVIQNDGVAAVMDTAPGADPKSTIEAAVPPGAGEQQGQ